MMQQEEWKAIDILYYNFGLSGGGNPPGDNGARAL